MRLVDVLRPEEDAAAKAERVALVAALMQQGFPEADAEEAAYWEVDPEAMRELLARGCDRHLAVRILGRL